MSVHGEKADVEVAEPTIANVIAQHADMEVKSSKNASEHAVDTMKPTDGADKKENVADPKPAVEAVKAIDGDASPDTQQLRNEPTLAKDTEKKEEATDVPSEPAMDVMKPTAEQKSTDNLQPANTIEHAAAEDVVEKEEATVVSSEPAMKVMRPTAEPENTIEPAAAEDVVEKDQPTESKPAGEATKPIAQDKSTDTLQPENSIQFATAKDTDEKEDSTGPQPVAEVTKQISEQNPWEYLKASEKNPWEDLPDDIEKPAVATRTDEKLSTEAESAVGPTKATEEQKVPESEQKVPESSQEDDDTMKILAEAKKFIAEQRLLRNLQPGTTNKPATVKPTAQQKRPQNSQPGTVKKIAAEMTKRTTQQKQPQKPPPALSTARPRIVEKFDKTYLPVDQEEFRRDCLALGFGWPPNGGLKASRHAC